MNESSTDEIKSTEVTEALSETKSEDELIRPQEGGIPSEEEVISSNSKETINEEVPQGSTDSTVSLPIVLTETLQTSSSVEKTEDLSETKSKDELIGPPIVLKPCNEEILKEKEEKLLEIKEIIIQEVTLDHPIDKTETTALEPILSVEEVEILETKDGDENTRLQSVKTTSNEEVVDRVKDTPTADNETIMDEIKQDVVTETTTQETSLTEKSIVENLTKPTNASVTTQDTAQVLEKKAETTPDTAKKLTKKLEIQQEISETKVKEKLEKDNPTTIAILPQQTNSEKDTNIVEIQDKEISSPAQKSPQDKNLSETTKSPTKSSSKDEYAEHVTYTEDGSAIYTDPQTKYQYKWCTETNKWIPKDSSTISATTNPYENEHYKWCNETQKWLPKNTQVTETEHYKWDAEKNEWVAKVKTTTSMELTNPANVNYDIAEDGQRTYTDKDGTIFFWDVEKNAWFPKIDDDFMARYQMSYGFIDNTSESEREKEKLELQKKLLKEQELARLVEEAKANDEANEKEKQGGKRKAQQEPPKWFEIDPMQNTKVYVSNLPLDITLDEFTEVMSKCGMIMRDPQTQKFKLKLYTESDGQIKGDGLCDYIKVESVDLALKILDEYELRGRKMRVQRAQFQMRGEYNPALKPKRKKKDKEKLAKIKEKLFDWRPEKMRGERSKHEKTVIIKNLFHPDLFEKEVQLILDYQNDLREECSKCGTVRKVVIYDRHSEGVAQINMSSPEEADLVIQMMQGRFFGKRQLTADHWDGKTKYKVEETEEEVKKRLSKWDQYLEAEENKKLDLQKEEELKKLDLQKEEQIKPMDLQKEEEIKISNLQTEEEIIKLDLLKAEKPDEKSIHLETTEKSKVTQIVENLQMPEENENSDLNPNLDLHLEEQDIEKSINFETTKKPELKDLELDENKNMDLQKDEQDIEKTITFENTEKTNVTKNVEDLKMEEEN